MSLYKVTLAVLLVLAASDDAEHRGRYAHYPGMLPNAHIQIRHGQSGEDRQYFLIASPLNGYVMDILNRDRRPGAHVIMWSQKPISRSNQVWYYEPNGMIRSQMNGLCIDVGRDGYAFMNYCHEEAPLQKWVFTGKKIKNMINGTLILDISYYNPNLGARVAMWTDHDGLNQHWYRKEYSGI